MGDITDCEENLKFGMGSRSPRESVYGQGACCANAKEEDTSADFILHVNVLILSSEYVCV
jgi:hypothetical protein